MPFRAFCEKYFRANRETIPTPRSTVTAYIPEVWYNGCMTTLLTGASSGIGAAIAIACAKRGDSLFLCGRNGGRLDEVAAKCRAAGAAAVHAAVLDVTDSDATADWIRASNQIAPLERVFANAGVSTGCESPDNVRNTFAINVGGTVNTVLPALEIFQDRRTGHRQIVLTASIAGYGPLRACPSYSATKNCVKTWGLALREQFATRGIKISAVCPGFVRSRITDANTCPMPFFMEADRAAKIILNRVERNVGLIAFPWPMRLASWWLSTLPFRLNELLNRLLPRKTG